MDIHFREVILEEEIRETVDFLQKFDLKFEKDIVYTINGYDKDNKIIATASIAENVIKCFAIDGDYQETGLSLKIISNLIQKLNSLGINHYFVFTKIENMDLFENIAFNVIAKTDDVCLLESGANDIVSTLKDLKIKYNIDDSPKAALIINCNPMTNGHLYLLEKAASNNEQVIVFVVEEDKSSFPFKDRFDLVKSVAKRFDNVHVVPSTNYIISNATFPTYFLDEKINFNKVYTELDGTIFKKYFMPMFNIKKRYVGTEPYSIRTNEYNETMQEILGDNLIIIERKRIDSKEKYISASYVRKILKEKADISEIKKLVPNEVFKYLTSSKSMEIIEKIKDSDSRH